MSKQRLTREQIATSMAKACHDEPCYPVQNGSYGVCAICPNCHSMKGLYLYGHEHAETTWMCKCGCHVFTISETGAVCWKCGVKQEF